MIEVGAFEAKTHLSSLLERVESTIAALRTHRTGMRLGGLDWKELRDAGRR